MADETEHSQPPGTRLAVAGGVQRLVSGLPADHHRDDAMPRHAPEALRPDALLTALELGRSLRAPGAAPRGPDRAREQPEHPMAVLEREPAGRPEGRPDTEADAA